MRDIRKRRYVLAGVLTLMVFVLGLLVGLVIEGKRVEMITGASQELKVDIGSLQLQYAFIGQLAQVGNCGAFTKTFDKNLDSLESTRIKLAGYQNDASVNRREFDLLRRTYILSQVEYLLLSMKSKELCGTDVVNMVYFFSRDCTSCDDQSFVLSFLKQKFNERLFIFGFDASFEQEPLLELLETTYNVTSFPTTIISDDRYVGFMSKDNLTQTICGLYKSRPEYCGS
ncbi:TPA: conjugal transfer protein TraF [Candidatus Woesearchaeota archaeon]|nr:conjugal transfer protein TraF [Candidatus Woesearchaeota archaeon]